MLRDPFQALPIWAKKKQILTNIRIFGPEYRSHMHGAVNAVLQSDFPLTRQVRLVEDSRIKVDQTGLPHLLTEEGDRDGVEWLAQSECEHIRPSQMAGEKRCSPGT